MAVNINDFRNQVLFIINKSQSGNSFTIPEFNLNCQAAQMQLFEKDRGAFLAKEEISDFLELFLKNLTTGVPIDGNLPYPSDFEHTSSIRGYYVRPEGKSVEIKVQAVKNSDWGEVGSSQLQAPTKRFPKYSEFKNEFRFLPKDIGIVMIDYFKTPIAPVWAYTIVNGRPVYDAANSVDFEFDSFATNAVIANFLAIIGVNLKDIQLAQFAELYKTQTSPIL